MTVIKLPTEGILLHSPVPISEDLYDELNRIGQVEHIVAPNCFHHVFVPEAKEHYPNSVLWAAPGLSEKRKDINFDAIISTEEPVWKHTLEFEYIEGMPRINEVVFFHKPSNSFICTDFIFNIRRESNLVMKFLWSIDGIYKNFGQGRLFGLLIKNNGLVTESINRILNWDFERIIMAHGDIIDCDNKALFEILKNNYKLSFSN